MVNISVLNRKQIFRFTFLLVLLFLGILVYFYRVPIGTFLKERLTFLEIRTTHGNCGRPLPNLSSEVVGINVAVASGAENIGFAIPINLVKSAVEQFEKTGTIVRPFLGVSYYLITEDAAKVQDLPQGAFVQGVTAGSAAAKAGVKVGDVITTIEGESITEKSSLAKIILKYEVGDKVVLAVVRNGRTITLSATLGKSKAD